MTFKTDFFKEIYKDILNSKSDNPYSRVVLFKQKSGEEIVLSISQGGIHSVNNNQIFKENEEEYLVDADIASLYPTLFDNYKFLRKDLQIVLSKYLDIKADRIEAKRTGNKIKDTFLKLILNSFSGLVDSNVTWMYSPEHILALRITGQLIQLRFLEELNEAGISMIFSNTDGSLCKVPKDKIEIYHKIAEDISKEFKVQWEYCLLKNINFINTNTYLSHIKEEYMLDENLNKINIKTESKIKRKGSFFRYDKDIPLGDSVNEQVIAKALEAYLVNNIEPSEFISNPEKYNLHIFDYCKSNKISKDYEVWYNNEIQQQLNRYYFSKNKPYLFKKKRNKSTFEHVNVGEGVIIYNNHINKPFKEYDINYVYYIAKTNAIIQELQNFNQLTLF